MKNGNYQLTMLDHFSKPIYNRRKFMEMVISVPRRVFNDKNYSKTNRQINKETKLKNICYHHIKIKISTLVGILSAYHLFRPPYY